MATHCLKCGKVLREDDLFVCDDCVPLLSDAANDIRVYFDTYLPLPPNTIQKDFYQARMWSRSACEEIFEEFLHNDNDPSVILMQYIDKQYRLIMHNNNPEFCYIYNTNVGVAQDLARYLNQGGYR